MMPPKLEQVAGFLGRLKDGNITVLITVDSKGSGEVLSTLSKDSCAAILCLIRDLVRAEKESKRNDYSLPMSQMQKARN